MKEKPNNSLTTTNSIKSKNLASTLLGFGPLFVIIAALFWSMDGLLRRNIYTLNPLIIVFYEHLFGCLLLLPFIKKWFVELKLLTHKEWISVVVISLFSGVLGTLLYTAALGMVNYIQYSVVVLLQQLQPIWAVGAAAILLKEKIDSKFIIWVVLALVSSYLITFADLSVNIISGKGTIIAGLFALGAGIFWGSSTAVSKVILTRVSFITATALRFIGTTVISLLFVLSFGKAANLSGLSSSDWLTLVIITLTTGLVALIIYYYGLKKTPARVATICELVWPASAIFIDYFYFQKGLSVTQILGVLLLLFTIRKVVAYKK